MIQYILMYIKATYHIMQSELQLFCRKYLICTVSPFARNGKALLTVYKKINFKVVIH